MKKQTTFMIFFIMSFFAMQGFLMYPIVKVTPANMGKWKMDDLPDNGYINFMPPAQGNVPRGLEFNPIDSNNIRIRLSGHGDTRLKDITKLQYSTFTENENGFVPYVVLQVALETNKNVKIIYEPRLQDVVNSKDGVKPGIWQEWDLLKGKWWLNDDTGHDPDHNPIYYTIKELLSQYPDAKLLNSTMAGFKGESIRLTAGGSYSEWSNSKTYANNFIIGTKNQPKEYQFEK